MKATVQTDHTHDFRLTGAALVLALCMGGARAENLVFNGDFSWQPIGATATASGAGAQVDTTTFSYWRLFAVDATGGTYLRGTIVTNPVTGGRALRLDYNQAGAVPADCGLDREAGRVPVTARQRYVVSFDAAYVGGATGLQVVVPEFAGDHAFTGQQVIKTLSVTNAGFQRYTFHWTPLTNVTVEAGLSFRPALAGTNLTMSLLLANVRMSAESGAAVQLFTGKPAYALTDHVVSTSVFVWFDSAGGQISGPWRPLEGRTNWTGESEWWKGQIKQMMMANIDMLYVHLSYDFEPQRINLFQALNQLRSEGYDVPTVAPFLDPLVTWYQQPVIDLATEAGKDTFVNLYIRFFNQYYAVNQDAHADDYLARFGNRAVCDVWHTKLNLTNLGALTISDVTARLKAAFGWQHPLFSNTIYMVTTALNPPTLDFADEKVPQFEITDYASAFSYNGVTSVQMKGGYWDQNVRNPGSILKRDGGWHYTNAWSQVDRGTVRRVYIESWNEYDEGSGIYAADPGAPHIQPGSGNANTDVWSSANDPYEYIRATAKAAAAFNDVPNHAARILWHNLPERMEAGETRQVRVIVRNDGDAAWTAAENYKFGEVELLDPVLFGPGRYPLNDAQDEIPVYGGLFRGRPKTFQLTLTAPAQAGTYITHWRMVKEWVEWFGEELTLPITVVPANPGTRLGIL